MDEFFPIIIIKIREKQICRVKRNEQRIMSGGGIFGDTIKKSNNTKSKGLQFLRLGVPFLSFAVFGSFGLSKMVQGRLEIKDAKQEVNDFRAPAQTQRKRERRRREDARREEMIERANLEEYELKEVPRPKGSWW